MAAANSYDLHIECQLSREKGEVSEGARRTGHGSVYWWYTDFVVYAFIQRGERIDGRGRVAGRTTTACTTSADMIAHHG